MRNPNQKILPEVMNWRQIRDYLGGNIGRDKILALMKNGVISDARWLGNKLVVDKKDVDEFIERTKRVPIQNGIIESTPIAYLKEVAGKIAG